VAKASYELAEVRKLISEQQYTITVTALQDALSLGFDDQDICECIIEQLSETHLYKTMPAEKKPGLMQDVYRITYEGQPIYLKLQICDEKAVVISFKADESAYRI
jgi:hypothetical protein